jgi:hypothetical protein
VPRAEAVTEGETFAEGHVLESERGEKTVSDVGVVLRD